MSSSIPARWKAKLPRQAVPAKIFHWLNLISLSLMLGSGLQIYNANPVFGGRSGWQFPEFLRLGGWLAGGRDWHFAVMWVYSLNLLAYGIFVFATRRWRKRFASGNDLKAIRVSQNRKRVDFARHRLLYTAIVPILLLSIASGLALYKPASLHWLAAPFGNWQTLRVVHFLTVPIVLSFTAIHSLLALKTGGLRSLRSMFL
jgi:thiosulfate reductase cytochrome b subunit